MAAAAHKRAFALKQGLSLRGTKLGVYGMEFFFFPLQFFLGCYGDS